mgnify:CR=1 FL=1|tara:strand:+ start:2318 stop:2431 length:114 start_codon:yes stop_codon:yes gene_type:complete
MNKWEKRELFIKKNKPKKGRPKKKKEVVKEETPETTE